MQNSCQFHLKLFGARFNLKILLFKNVIVVVFKKNVIILQYKIQDNRLEETLGFEFMGRTLADAV